jgi:O-antigen/teichoic acid export membrane protein
MFLNATDRQILKIAIPLIFSNLSVPLVGLVDNAVLGHLSSPLYLASAGLGAIIMSYVLFSFGFINQPLQDILHSLIIWHMKKQSVVFIKFLLFPH